MKQISAVLNFVCGALITVLLVSQFAFKKNEGPKNQWYAPPVPEQLSFAGEKVPLERWDVKEKFDRELLINYYNPGTVLFLLKMAHRYFPIISERLKAAGVPDDFKYLCIAESNMVGNARSKSGAIGYWQFMSGTASGYGLRITAE